MLGAKEPMALDFNDWLSDLWKKSILLMMSLSRLGICLQFGRLG